MRLGYNTNGFPQHQLSDVVTILAELDYQAVAITPDVLQLDPFDGRSLERATALGRQCRDLGLAIAVETGARFVLEARRKHQPTLLSAPEGAGRRLDMLRRCLDLAQALEAETFSFWSGRFGDDSPEPSREVLLDRLCAGTEALLDAAGGSTHVCFEPEPGMLVASMAELDEFLGRLARDDLGIMLDVGHVPVTEPISAEAVIRQVGPRLGGLQLDDCPGGRHDHAFPGEGDLDWPAVVAAIQETGFGGLACLELPRHAHDPVQTATRARAFFRELGV